MTGCANLDGSGGSEPVELKTGELEKGGGGFGLLNDDGGLALGRNPDDEPRELSCEFRLF